MCLCRHPVHIQLRPLWPFLESNSAWRRPSLNHHPQQDNFECWWCWLGWTASILRVQWNPSSVCFFEAGNYCEIYPIKYLCRYKSIWPCSISKKIYLFSYATYHTLIVLDLNHLFAFLDMKTGRELSLSKTRERSSETCTYEMKMRVAECQKLTRTKSFNLNYIYYPTGHHFTFQTFLVDLHNILGLTRIPPPLLWEKFIKSPAIL